MKSTTLRRVSVTIWTALNLAYVAFQIFLLLLGTHAVTDQFVGSLILIVYVTWAILRTDTETDSTPIGSFNRILSGQGNMKSIAIFANIKT